MKKLTLFIFLLVFTFNSLAQTENICLSLTSKVIYFMKSEQADSAYILFDEKVKAKLSRNDFEGIWPGLIKQFGELKTIGFSETERIPDYLITVTTLEFEKFSLNIRLSFNSENEISGIFFVPTPPKKYTAPPSYSKPSDYKEKDIKVISGKYILPGKITLPAKGEKYPVVILVHGSGPNDMDETIGPNKIFRDLAYGLAANGIASIRYHKRTFVYGNELSGDNFLTPQEEVLEDVTSAIQLAITLNGIDTQRIFILGHSLGAYLSPRIAQENPEIKGIIMLAAPSRKMEDIILDQYTYLMNFEGLTKEESKVLDNLKEQIALIKTNVFPEDISREKLPLGLPATYWLYLNSYDQLKEAQNLKIPIMIMQGERDYQVRMEDFKGWKNVLKANKNVSFKSFSKLNHLFIGGKGLSKPEEYNISANMDKKVSLVLGKWIRNIK